MDCILVSVYVVIVINYKITEFYGYLVHCNEVGDYQPNGHRLYIHFSRLLDHGLMSSHFSSKEQSISVFRISKRCSFHLREEQIGHLLTHFIHVCTVTVLII